MNGRCLCGALKWTTTGSPTWACYCHCDDCRRQCGAPIVAFIGLRLSDFSWNGARSTFSSSPGVTRHFCPTCGSPMAFQADHYPGEIHVYAAQLENPEAFAPEFHVHYEERLHWLGVADDDLPKHPRSAPESP